jgi:hypothetical protein
VSPPHDPAAGHREKSREPQIGDEDHHAEQQGQRFEIDRLIGDIPYVNFAAALAPVSLFGLLLTIILIALFHAANSPAAHD